jgi:hypothetical protein
MSVISQQNVLIALAYVPFGYNQESYKNYAKYHFYARHE